MSPHATVSYYSKTLLGFSSFCSGYFSDSYEQYIFLTAVFIFYRD